MPLLEQLEVFSWTLLIGMLAGICHVVYRVLRDTLRLKKFGTFAGDIIFWLLLTAIAFMLLLRANYGQLRLYVFIGLFLGAFLFARILGNYTYRLVRWMLYMAGRIIRLMALLFYYAWKAVTFPFRVLFTVVAFPLGLIGRLLGGAGRVAGSASRGIKVRITGLFGKILKSLMPRR
ncbi:MAG: spore cortex biosynthesis protein YabQ [Bacillota bacterium]